MASECKWQASKCEWPASVIGRNNVPQEMKASVSKERVVHARSVVWIVMTDQKKGPWRVVHKTGVFQTTVTLADPRAAWEGGTKFPPVSFVVQIPSYRVRTWP